MLNRQPKRGAVDLDEGVRTKNGLHSLLMMLVGAVVAIMFGVFLYLSPFFNLTPPQIQPETAVEPLPATTTTTQYEFYDILPEQEFRSVPEGVSVQSRIIEGQDETHTDTNFHADAVVQQDNTPAQSTSQHNTHADDQPVATQERPQDTTAADSSPAINITAVSPESTYILQVRSYTVADEADQRRAEVIMAGVDAEIVRRSSDGQTLYQVVSTPFSTRDNAMIAYKRLQNAGIDAVIVEQKRQ
ncbi:MAG: SPOR domain-containing protein [Moraxella sp.]|nr:SPOR domain-containing protein [Moraxella sp.]